MIKEDDNRAVFAFVSNITHSMHNVGVSIDDIAAFVRFVKWLM